MTSWVCNSGQSQSGPVKDGYPCRLLSPPTCNLGGLRGGSAFPLGPRRIRKLSLPQNTLATPMMLLFFAFPNLEKAATAGLRPTLQEA